MAVKNDIDITIGGKTITLSGVESEEYLREVASYLNAKLRNFTDDAAYWRLPNDMRNVMMQLNLADDFFKEHSQVVALQAQVQDLEEQRDRVLRELEDMQEAAQGAVSRISALESDVEDLRGKAQRAAAAENSAAKRFGAEKSRAEKLTEEMDALRRSKAEADKAVQRLRQELADTRESLQGELDKVKKDLEGKLSASESRHKKEVQELQTLRQKEMKAAEEQGRRALATAREDLSRQLKEAKAESAKRGEALAKATEENAKLREQCELARRNEESTRKKLTELEKGFEGKLAANTQIFRSQAQDAKQELEKVQEELVILQEQENARLQAAAKARGAMQELVQQYGRFGQSLDETAELMRAIE